jgi:signal transduction histidine kinase
MILIFLVMNEWVSCFFVGYFMSDNKKSILKIAFLLLAVAAIAALHYLTGSEASQYYDLICRLYYLPIILGGIWFCLRGGVSIALLVSIIYAPHVMFQWGSLPSVTVEQYFEILLFNMTGLLTGFLSSKLYFQQVATEKHIQKLSESYKKLREQADLIVEIEDQLRQADRLTALGELSAGMAHEIRNPLASIRGTAEILRDAMPEDNRYAEFSQILVNEADRLNKVVEDFLSFARSESDGQSQFKPHEVLHEVLQLSQQQAKKHNIQIHWQEQDLPSAVGDEAQFKQVFLNLILNALYAMDVGGDLWIETEVSDCGKIILKFKDNGPGIPEEFLDKVFNPFFTTKSEGTGLGLAITYRIVKNHCGQISVANRPEGGAEFTIICKPADQPCGDGDGNGTENSCD